jgi:hypothetical protein
MTRYILLALIISSLMIAYLIPPTDSSSSTQKLYFEFKKKDSSVTADGFLRYKGKWCPIVLNDSMAVIYE